jgi:hypothetical protein
MHSSFFWYPTSRRFDPCRGRFAYAGACSPRSERSERAFAPEGEGFATFMSDLHDAAFGAGGFGVPRPLRFLAWRLGLDRDQIAEVAKVLDRVKLERAQAGVDRQRAASEIAEALEGQEFDRERAERVRSLRLEASRRVQDALGRALEDLHRILDEDQRRRLATLIRSGALKL